ncbi:N-formylglutamate amidohydrolase [Croceibacterium ferulae]|uniref:N-formylglutamate amidohydrolase n=1 Tax=Croceibacterium ferulae TaxID=1854641 RepID=UPI001F4E974D|nr:N-formylglutamate amidohydrolase [Croceibacterium ferulae]
MTGFLPAAGGSPGAVTPPATIPGMDGQPAFTLDMPADLPLPILIAVPHAGRHYPPELTARMRSPAVASLRLEDRLVDLVGRAVARRTGAALLVAHAPRALVDLNRGPADMDWDMVARPWPGPPQHVASSRARSGLGLVPRRLSGLGELWRGQLAAWEVEERLARVHRPYHQALGSALARMRAQWGTVLLLDLHSMPPLSPRGLSDAADCVIGDRFGASCAPELAAVAIEQLARCGRRPAHNRPYAGGYVLDRHGAPVRHIQAVQLELCRTAYLDSRLQDAGPGLPRVVDDVAALVQRLATELTASAARTAQIAAE